MMSDIQVNLLICTIIVGTMFTFFGAIMKYQKAGDMINGFNYQKHDKNKVSKIMGNHLLFIGITIFILGALGVFSGNYIVLYKNLQIITIILTLLKVAYAINKYGKKK